MERDVRELENGMTATIVFEHDDSAEDPSEFEGSGKLRILHSKESFWSAMEEIFGSDGARGAVDSLVEGKALVCDGRAYLGIEKYSHSGDVLAVCRQGNFPDRKWDVSPIVGVWTPSAHDPVCSELPKRKMSSSQVLPEEISDKLKASAKSELETYNTWLSGDTWGYSVTVSDRDGSLVGEDSCWGYYGRADVERAASEAVSSIASPPRAPAP